MSFFAVHYDYIDDPRVDEVRPRHRAYLAQLAERGLLRASGPYVDTPAPSALLLFTAASAEQVEEALAADPFMTEGVVTAHTVTLWRPVIGAFATEAD